MTLSDTGLHVTSTPQTESVVRRQIGALTGIRIIAALWVVLFHINGNIASEFPSVHKLVAPLLAHGELGVDLFFVLSGYVLALNYVTRLGPRFDRTLVGHFLWARVARVWPVFFVTLLVAGLWHGFLMGTGRGDPVPPNDFSVLSFFRQALLVELWDNSSFDRLMWNGPAWSVSAEALAYAAFPILAIVLFQVSRVSGPGRLFACALVAALPVPLFVGAFGSMYFDWSWLLRIVCGFVAGTLMCEAVRRTSITDTVRRWASHVALAIIVLVIAWCYVAEAIGYGHLTSMVSPIFVVLVAALAVGDSHVVRLLGTRVFVVGGAASYSVYMVHMLVIEPFWWLQGNAPQLFAPGSAGSKIGIAVLPVVVTLCGYLLWRFFEEPARHHLHSMFRPVRTYPTARQEGTKRP